MSLIFAFIIKYKAWLFWCTLFSFGGFFLLLGMPGALLASGFDTALLLLGKGARPYPADTQWPQALLYTFILPWMCFASYLVLSHFLPDIGGIKSATLSIGAAILLLFSLHALFFNADALHKKVEKRAIRQGIEKQEKENVQIPSSLLYASIDLLFTPEELMDDYQGKKNITTYMSLFRMAVAEIKNDREKFVISDAQITLAQKIDEKIAALGNDPEKWEAKDFETNPEWREIRKDARKLAMDIALLDTAFKIYFNYPVNRMLKKIEGRN